MLRIKRMFLLTCQNQARSKFKRGEELVKLLYKQHTDHVSELISHPCLFLSTALKPKHATKYLIDFKQLFYYSLGNCLSFATNYELTPATSIKTDFFFLAIYSTEQILSYLK